MPGVTEIPRTSFSILRDIDVMEAINSYKRKQVILCGYETHICLYQSAMDLLHSGYEVYLVLDATSSRKLIDKEVAVQRITEAGGKLVTVEMLLFELLRDALNPAFKSISKLIK